MLIIVDIDGTLADLTVRYAAHVKPDHKEDRAAFQQWLDKVQDPMAMIKDRPIKQMKNLLDDLDHRLNTIIYLTGRSEHYRTLTQAWLKLHEFPEGTLLMREDNDWRKPCDYKEEHVKRLLLGNKDGFLAIDDDYDGCCSEMYRRLGGTHLKVMGDSVAAPLAKLGDS